MSTKNLDKYKKIFKPYTVMAYKIGAVLNNPKPSEADIARALEVTPQSVTGYIDKDYVPSDRMLAFCVKHKVSVDMMIEAGGNHHFKDIDHDVKSDKLRKSKKTVEGGLEIDMDFDRKIGFILDFATETEEIDLLGRIDKLYRKYKMKENKVKKGSAK